MDFSKIKLQDTGHKINYDSPRASEPKSEKIYPTLHLTEKDLKELKKLKFKDSVAIVAIGKVKSINQYNDEPVDVTIELQRIGIRAKALKELK